MRVEGLSCAVRRPGGLGWLGRNERKNRENICDF
jgi:hypothetical protein